MRLNAQQARWHASKLPGPIGATHRDIVANQREEFRRQNPVQDQHRACIADRREFAWLESDACIDKVRPTFRTSDGQKGDAEIRGKCRGVEHLQPGV